MLYTCSTCQYSTHVKCNFERHYNRKKPCILKKTVVNDNISQNNDKHNVGSNCPGVVSNCPGVVTKCQDVVSTNQHNDIEKDKSYTCKKCNRTLSSNRRLKYHETNCNGLSKLHCPHCKILFTSRYNKNYHLRTGKCKSSVNENNNENTKEHKITNNTNNEIVLNVENSKDVTNNIDKSNHVHVNIFGKENIDYLLNDPNILQRLKSYGKEHVYGLASIVKQIHCNEEQPQNNTIVKPLEYGDGMYIRNDENEWCFREYEDIRDVLIDSVSKYFVKYNEVKNSHNVKLKDDREARFIRTLCYILLSLSGSIPDDLSEELNINYSKIEDGENKIKDYLRKFDRANMANFHSFFCKNFSRKNGNDIIRN